MDIYSVAIAFFGGCVGSLFSFWSQKKLIEKKIRLEFLAKQSEAKDSAARVEINRLENKIEEAHILLSELQFAFSKTDMNIDWDANLSVSEYDAKYREFREKCSRLQMLIDLYAPELSLSVNSISGNMNLYWGNFRRLLHQTSQGESVKDVSHIFTHSQNISEEAYDLKYELSNYYSKKKMISQR